MQENYNDLAKSLAKLSKKPDDAREEKKENKETRTTYWDVIDKPIESNVISPLGVGRPKEIRDESSTSGRGRGHGRGRGGGRPPGSGRKPGQSSLLKVVGGI